MSATHGRASANYYYGGYYSYTYYSRYGQTDNLLNELHRYYVAAGKSELDTTAVVTLYPKP